ncbi:MAG: hypothetical protein ACYDAJ_02665 [Nitrosotalea sp.]
MTNATKPLIQSLKLLGGLIIIYVDNYASVKVLKGTFSHTFGAAGTSYGDLVKLTGGNYGAVPGITNLQMWGLESAQAIQGTGVIGSSGIGYSDDGAGTNYVSMIDVFTVFGQTAITNIVTGAFTVPTGKHPTAKVTESNGPGGSESIAYNIIALETN